MAVAIEDRLTDIWAEILGLDDLTVSDSFFDLGGTSIQAEQIAARINDAFGCAIRGTDVLRQPTVARLAAALRQVLGDSSGVLQDETD